MNPIQVNRDFNAEARSCRRQQSIARTHRGRQMQDPVVRLIAPTVVLNLDSSSSLLSTEEYPR